MAYVWLDKARLFVASVQQPWKAQLGLTFILTAGPVAVGDGVVELVTELTELLKLLATTEEELRTENVKVEEP